MKKLIILVSSKGKNVVLAETIEKSASLLGFIVNIVNLVDLNLPLYSTLEESNAVPSQAIDLTKNMLSSDSLIVIAPEYNGSMPPVLNNAIAWISRSSENWRQAFNGRPTLIATHSGGGGTHVLMAMRQQLSFIGANVIGRQILTTSGKELDLVSLEMCLKQLL